MSDEKSMGQVIQIDEARIRDHLGEMVRGTVGETLNAMLDAEADQLCGAGRGGLPWATLFRCGRTIPPARFAGLPSEREMLLRRGGC